MRIISCGGAVAFSLITIHLSCSLSLSTAIQNRLSDIGPVEIPPTELDETADVNENSNYGYSIFVDPRVFSNYRFQRKQRNLFLNKEIYDYVDRIRQLRELADLMDMRSPNDGTSKIIVPNYPSKDHEGNEMSQLQRFRRMELSKGKKSANTINHFLRDRKGQQQTMLHFLRDRRGVQNQLSHFLRDRKLILAQGESLPGQRYDESDTDFLRQDRSSRTQSHFLRDRKSTQTLPPLIYVLPH